MFQLAQWEHHCGFWIWISERTLTLLAEAPTSQVVLLCFSSSLLPTIALCQIGVDACILADTIHCLPFTLYQLICSLFTGSWTNHYNNLTTPYKHFRWPPTWRGKPWRTLRRRRRRTRWWGGRSLWIWCSTLRRKPRLCAESEKRCHSLTEMMISLKLLKN